MAGTYCRKILGCGKFLRVRNQFLCDLLTTRKMLIVTLTWQTQSKCKATGRTTAATHTNYPRNCAPPERDFADGRSRVVICCRRYRVVDGSFFWYFSACHSSRRFLSPCFRPFLDLSSVSSDFGLHWVCGHGYRIHGWKKNLRLSTTQNFSAWPCGSFAAWRYSCDLA